MRNLLLLVSTWAKRALLVVFSCFCVVLLRNFIDLNLTSIHVVVALG
jgi:hypothetical protein